MQSLNEENQNLIREKNNLQKELDHTNSQMLLMRQIVEEEKRQVVDQVKQLESELE
jgi:hypothetical protein